MRKSNVQIATMVHQFLHLAARHFLMPQCYSNLPPNINSNSQFYLKYITVCDRMSIWVPWNWYHQFLQTKEVCKLCKLRRNSKRGWNYITNCPGSVHPLRSISRRFEISELNWLTRNTDPTEFYLTCYLLTNLIKK